VLVLERTFEEHVAWLDEMLERLVGAEAALGELADKVEALEGSDG
jgi:hypothetical protein